MNQVKTASVMARLRRILFGAAAFGVSLGAGLGIFSREYATSAVAADEYMACADLDSEFGALYAEPTADAVLTALGDAESTDARVNVNVDARSNQSPTNAALAYGLTGAVESTSASTNATIAISEGTSAYVAKLDETSETFGAVLQGFDLTVDALGRVVVGSTTADAEGRLTVVGASDSGSRLSILSGGALFVGEGGLLEIGGETAVGAVEVAGDASFTILGSSSEDETYGAVVNEKGTLVVGSPESVMSSGAFEVDGSFANRGTTKINNAGGATAVFGEYSDAATGSLTTTGAIVMNRGAGESDALTINGKLEATDWTALSDATFASGSSASISGLATVGSETSGATLTISGKTGQAYSTASFGGLKIYSSSDEDGEVVGGTLKLGSNAIAQITGLSTKFDATGARAADGLYDAWLGSSFDLDGFLFASPESGASPYLAEFSRLGIRYSGASTIGANGGLYATDLTLSVGADSETGASTLTNAGGMRVSGALTVNLEDSASSFEFVNLGASSKGSSIGSWTLTEGLTLTNGVEGDEESAAALTVKELGISGGAVRANGKSVLTVDELTIDEDAQNGGKRALAISDGASVKAGTLTVKRGLAALESTDGAGGLNFASGTSTFVVGESGQSSGDYAQLQILGTDGTFGAGTLKLEGQGLVVAEQGRALTFAGTTVSNASERSDYALSADSIVFTNGASYSGGKILRTSGATFKTGTTLNLTLGNDLTLTEGGSLTMESGAVLTTEFGADGTSAGKVVLSGDATAKIAEGVTIKATNVSTLASGNYSAVLIQTDSSASVYEGTAESGAFYTMRTEVSEDGKNLLLRMNVSGDATSYATTANQISTAKYVDAIRSLDSVSESLRADLDAFTALRSREDVGAALDAITSSHRANMANLTMNSPWRSAFANVSLDGNLAAFDPSIMTPYGATEAPYVGGRTAMRGQAPIAYAPGFYGAPTSGGAYVEGLRGAWFSANYRGVDVKSDGNSEKFGITDVGMNVGVEAGREGGRVIGATFGYSQPKLYSDSSRAHASNFQLGVYGGATIWDALQARFYVGGGLQDYAHKRTVEFDETSEFHRSSFNGQSLAAAIKFSRPFAVDVQSAISPVLQFDYQQVWLDAATESGNGFALAYDKSDWSQVIMRAGLETEFNSPFLKFNAHAYYGLRLDGDEAPKAKMRFVGVDSRETATILGVKQGESFVDAGVSALGYLDCERRWSIAGGYDFLGSEKTTSHLGTISTSWTF